MLQTIEGRKVYVVEFDTTPELPITWSTDEEKPYALALAQAIHSKVITEPGKNAIEIVHDAEGKKYQITRVVE